jgi:crossover junction endodeoxyribonuclease RuvC
VRVLGIDPGSACTGYGVLDEQGQQLRIITSGVIRTGKNPLSERLVKIFSGLEDVIKTHEPDAMAVEEVFHAKNVKSALVLGHARGIALLTAGRAAIEVFEYPARKVKQTITGHGAASKEQVRTVLQATLGDVPKSLDASDALAVALCHLRWYTAVGN